MPTQTAETNVLTADALLNHWQEHRRLTRRVIEAFPEDHLFHFSIANLRPFSEMAWEFIRMAVTIVDGVSTGEWKESTETKPTTKAELLQLWDHQTTELNQRFPQIPAHRFTELDTAFGFWTNPGVVTLQYAMDNEIHHRGQAFVYLRALNIEPPSFWQRD